jgi:arylformamidase
LRREHLPARKEFAMVLYDISVAISSSLQCYPGDPPVRLSPLPVPSGGEPFRVSRLAFGSHTGTHVDAPAHLLGGGATVDEIPLELLVGPCLVVDLTAQAGEIEAGLLKKLPVRGVRRLLFHTRNSALWEEPGFVEEFVALTPAAAAWLVEVGVQLVGVDYLSVERSQTKGRVHRTLLEAGVVILEGLNLAGVEAGEYELICLPLKIGGGDGAPCRAVLRGPDVPPSRP